MFENKIALITGSSKGIGAAIAKELASKKCNVVINYNSDLTSALKVQEQCQKYGVQTLIIKADISKEDEIINMIEQIITTFGKLDILINNAGIAIDTLFEEKTKDNFMKTLDINLVGTFLVSKYASVYMLKNKYGKIVNITSTNGINKYFPMCLDYDASKAGIISLTHNLALQFAPYINVNAVAPGWVGTENELNNVDQEYIKLEEEKIFLRRIGTPEEIAKLVSFLVSDDASYINNEVIRIDGGTY
ncbi:MAG: SDR family oxidoreductase [Bacilli bacterium]|nr:SDR family oxidoreductase [Bacilli bacterium]